MAGLWTGFSGPAEIVLPRGFEPFGDSGWQWFSWPPGTSDEDAARALSASEQKLWPVIASLAQGRRLIVTGFSQGAMLTYLIAERHADSVALAVPISGKLPRALMPHEHRPAAPIHALHGGADPLISVELARETVTAFERDGAQATLHVFDRVPHTVTPEMQAELWSTVLAPAPQRQP
jgi:phospholipase/carboxylesterase